MLEVGSSWLSLLVEGKGWDGPVCRETEEPLGSVEKVKCHPDLFAPLFGSLPLNPVMYWAETFFLYCILACFFSAVEAFKDLVVVSYSEQGSLRATGMGALSGRIWWYVTRYFTLFYNNFNSPRIWWTANHWFTHSGKFLYVYGPKIGLSSVCALDYLSFDVCIL